MEPANQEFERNFRLLVWQSVEATAEIYLTGREFVQRHGGSAGIREGMADMAHHLWRDPILVEAAAEYSAMLAETMQRAATNLRQTRA